MKILKPARDLGGNCVVSAFPIQASCSADTSASTSGSPTTEVLQSWMTDLASQ